MISIVIPAYKEAENLKFILPQIKKVMNKRKLEYEILVVDTMKPMDDTKQICIDNEVRYVPRQNGNSYGDAIRTGFDSAQGEFTVVMDADGSHDPKDILKFYKVIQNHKIDLVIGSRYCRGGQTENTFILKFMSWALNVSYRIFFKLNVHDVSDSFRMYRTEQLKQLKFECNNFDIVEEILIKLSIINKPFIAYEVPIKFNQRVYGESKRKLLKFIFSYVKTMYRLRKIKSKAHLQIP